MQLYTLCPPGHSPSAGSVTASGPRLVIHRLEVAITHSDLLSPMAKRKEAAMRVRAAAPTEGWWAPFYHMFNWIPVFFMFKPTVATYTLSLLFLRYNEKGKTTKTSS